MSYYYLTAILTAASSAGLSMALGYPEVLLDPPSFGDSLMGAGAIAGFAGLFASGVALVLLARNDSRPLRRRTGVAAGLCVAAGAMLGLTPLSGPAFAAGAIVAPLLQALWTLQVSRRPLAVLAALGLAVTAARSVVWAVNAAAPLDGGFHITSAVLTVVALPGQPLWAAWLIWAAGRRWRNALLAAGLVAVQAFLIIVGTPTPATTDMPAVPSAAGQLRYVVSLALREQFALPATYEELLAERARRAAAPVEAPAGTTLERVDAGGVPAEKYAPREPQPIGSSSTCQAADSSFRPAATPAGPRPTSRGRPGRACSWCTTGSRPNTLSPRPCRTG